MRSQSLGQTSSDDLVVLGASRERVERVVFPILFGCFSGGKSAYTQRAQSIRLWGVN